MASSIRWSTFWFFNTYAFHSVTLPIFFIRNDFVKNTCCLICCLDKPQYSHFAWEGPFSVGLISKISACQKKYKVSKSFLVGLVSFSVNGKCPKQDPHIGRVCVSGWGVGVPCINPCTGGKFNRPHLFHSVVTPVVCVSDCAWGVRSNAKESVPTTVFKTSPRFTAPCVCHTAWPDLCALQYRKHSYYISHCYYTLSIVLYNWYR